MRQQGVTPMYKRGTYKKHHALKLSCIILSTKSERDKLKPPINTWLQLYNIPKKESLKSWIDKPLPSKIRRFLGNLSFQVHHHIVEGTDFQIPWIQHFFNRLLHATNTSLTLKGWTQEIPIKERGKDQSEEAQSMDKEVVNRLLLFKTHSTPTS